MPVDISPTIIIGLGGTGGLICKMIKEKLLAYYGNEDDIPKLIKIIQIDSTSNNEPEEDSMELPALTNNLIAKVAKQELKAILKNVKGTPEIAAWLDPDHFPIDEIESGCGQCRQAGRLAFWRHRSADLRIKEKIVTQMTEVTSVQAVGDARRKGINVLSNVPEVFMINSLAGGTGNGMFLDIAGLIKNSFPNAVISLIALLPKLFEGKILSLSQSVFQMYANSYAALKEIGHFMIPNKWEVTYNISNRDVESFGGVGDERVFKYVYLIDNMNKEGQDLQDRAHVSPLIAEYIFHTVISFGASINAQRANINRYLLNDMKCNSFGVSILNYPVGEILEVCKYTCGSDILDNISFQNYQSKEVTEALDDKNVGMMERIFNIDKLKKDLCKSDSYVTQNANDIASLKKKVSIVNAVNMQIAQVEKDYKKDIASVEKNENPVSESLKKSVSSEMKGYLVSKGPKFTIDLLNQLKTRLASDISSIRSTQQQAQLEATTLDTKLTEDKKLLDSLKKKTTEFPSTWERRCGSNLSHLLNDVQNKFGNLLLGDKLGKIIAILDNLLKQTTGYIDMQISLIMKLENEMSNIHSNFNIAKKKALDRMAVLSCATETKVGCSDNEVDTFYKTRFQDNNGIKTSVFLASTMQRKLPDWLGQSSDNVEKEIMNEVEQQIMGKMLRGLTLKDAYPDNAALDGDIGKTYHKGIPFWNHHHSMYGVYQSSCAISGFSAAELQQYSSLNGVPLITSDSEQSKRRILFFHLEAGVPISSITGLEEYREAYDDYMKRGDKWIHVLPGADKFDELGSGKQEDDLLLTCQDFGIVYKVGEFYEYDAIEKKKGKESVKKVKIAQGFNNTVEKLKLDQETTKKLIEMLSAAIKRKTSMELRTYLDDHNEPDTMAFAQNHKNKYKDQGGDSIPSHSIPYYIEEDIRKKI